MDRHADDPGVSLAPREPDVLRLDRRLRRIEGQVRGIGRMIDDQRDCADILQQIAAARCALGEVALALLEAHVRRHVGVSHAGGGGRDLVAEVMAPVARLVRSR
jgi:DNA-binding FrmR family transcriptional regulator